MWADRWFRPSGSTTMVPDLMPSRVPRAADEGRHEESMPETPRRPNEPSLCQPKLASRSVHVYPSGGWHTSWHTKFRVE